jgi:uncharacterized RDD family membrane protein YckC
VYCPHCGVTAGDDARFCRSCGATLHQPSPVAAQASTTTAVASSPQPATPYASPAPGSSDTATALRAGYLASNVGTVDAAAYSGPIAYGGFWRRFVAYFIDVIIVYIVSIVVGFLVGMVLGFARVNSDIITFAGGILGFAIGILYWAVQESSQAQATLGKRALGMRVTDLNGQRISFGRALGRTFAKWISGLIFCIGYIMAGFTERKQALHDMIAGTLVVRPNP